MVENAISARIVDVIRKTVKHTRHISRPSMRVKKSYLAVTAFMGYSEKNDDRNGPRAQGI